MNLHEFIGKVAWFGLFTAPLLAGLPVLTSNKYWRVHHE